MENFFIIQALCRISKIKISLAILKKPIEFF